MMSKQQTLLVMGPSGVGKTAAIKELIKLDSRFQYIQPYTTRTLRTGEAEKISISSARFEELAHAGQFLVVNVLYGIRYGTPRASVADCFAHGKFPVIDWPVDKAELIAQKLREGIYGVYLLPPSLDALRSRLADGRDPSEIRLTAAIGELEAVNRGEYDAVIDRKLTSAVGELREMALAIRDGFIEAVETDARFAGQFPGTRLKLKNDRYRQLRGGRARLIEVTCTKCSGLVLLYQKDGRGHLFRCYLNRIVAPLPLAALQTTPAIAEPRDLSILECPSCRTGIGMPMRHLDGRLAFRLRQGLFRTRPIE
jgi:guanylate kinase